MRLIRPSETACDRAREALSVALDGELSELERARLDLHLELCASCRAFEADSSALAQTLRNAAPLELSVPIVLPRRSRLSRVRAAQTGAAAAALALVAALATSHGIGQRAASGPRIQLSPNAALGHDDELAPVRHPTPRIDFRTAL
jgi:predicted anti-sigma-YlaC factor YlaD